MKKETPRNTATPVMSWMKCSISMAMGVLPTSSPRGWSGDAAHDGGTPRATTTPWPWPVARGTALRLSEVQRDPGPLQVRLPVWNSLVPPGARPTLTASPSTQLVEKKVMFRVSRGLSCVQSGERVWGSDSPVREELSTWGWGTGDRAQPQAWGQLAFAQRRFQDFCLFICFVNEKSH